MPQKIYMNISNQNSTYVPRPNINTSSLGSIPTKSFSSFGVHSFINRIHNAKPGCSACGKH